MGKRSRESSMEIKLMINKTNSRVLYAEAGKEFVDLLLSILMLPLGSIAKLALCFHLSADKNCIKNLYNSLEKLSDSFMKSDKSILLDPKVVSTTYTNKILNIQSPRSQKPAEPPKYYVCSNASSLTWKHSISKQCGIIKCSCGYIVNRELNLVDSALEPKPEPDLEPEPGYVKKSANFVITDDLSIIPVNSTATIVNLWNKIGIRESSDLGERNITVGAIEVKGLLKAAMLSNTALNDVFKGKLHTSIGKRSREASMEIKLMINKTNSRVLYAEAGKEFVDLLLSILTLPLGSIAKLALRSHLSADKNCIKNLYNSLEKLSDSFMKSDKSILLDPKVVSTTYTNKILNIQSPRPQKPAEPSKYYVCGNASSLSWKHSLSTEWGIVKCLCGYNVHREVNLVDSALELKPETDLEPEPGYVKKSANFVITDDLSFIPLNSTATIVNLWNNIGIRQPIEVEERNITVGANEVMGLLRAAMLSNTALNDVFKGKLHYSAKVAVPAMGRDRTRTVRQHFSSKRAGDPMKKEDECS